MLISFQVLDRYVTTVICVLGCIGNIINLTVLVKVKRKKLYIYTRDSGATAGLITLATTEMLFCMVLVPRGFISSQKAVFPGPTFWLYYQVYGTWLVTTFILASTWVTVTISGMRYLAICHPLLYARFIGGTCWSNYVYLLSCLFGGALNIPSIWQYSVEGLTDGLYLIDIGVLGLSSHTGHVYQWIRAITATFIPALLLVYCNISLLAAIHRSRHFRKPSHVRRQPKIDGNNRVTLLLITIATAFMVLVIPSELMDLVHGAVLQKTANARDVLLIRSVTNILQVINFSFNFILYCAVEVKFRRTLLTCLCGCPRKGPSNVIEKRRNRLLQIERH